MSWYDSDRSASGAAGYRTAEICLNGHVTTSDIEEYSVLAARFCPDCGAQTIRACPKCNSPIRGYLHIPGVLSTADYSRPNHCHNCGVAFPWFADKIAAAKEYAAELEGLDEADRTQLQGVIEDLASGGTRTDLAASRFKRLMKKAGLAAGSGLYKVILDVASELAKKAITGS